MKDQYFLMRKPISVFEAKNIKFTKNKPCIVHEQYLFLQANIWLTFGEMRKISVEHIFCLLGCKDKIIFIYYKWFLSKHSCVE